MSQQSRDTLPFHEAVREGIIEKDTGTYIDNVTGERIFILDAINKGGSKLLSYNANKILTVGLRSFIL